MITYKGIVAYFDAICDRHQQIQSFTYGELDLFDKDKFTMYPALHLTPTGTAIDDQTLVYGFDVVVFDRYNVASNKMRNEAQCLSDSLLILQDICKELTDGKYFINEDTLISMDMPIVAQPFIDTEPDNCSGWSTSFNVITPNEASACSIPYYNSEIWNNTTVTLPSGTPTGYAWYSIMNTNSHITFDGQQVDAMSAFKDTLVGSDTVTMNGSSLTFDLIKNALFFRDTSPSIACYLEHAADLVGSTWTFFLKIKDFSRFGQSTLTNSILSFKNAATDEVKVNVSNANGKLTLSHATTSQSEFAICPTNGTNLDTAHRRQEPLTIALTFDASATHIRLFHSDSVNEVVDTLTSSFDLDGGNFHIGAKTLTSFCNFYMQEFFISNTVMTDADIYSTMQWLNYR